MGQEGKGQNGHSRQEEQNVQRCGGGNRKRKWEPLALLAQWSPQEAE